MILAAGRGARMKPLTDNCPKPLLKINGIALIEYHIKALAKAGINDIVINHAWCGQQLVDYLKDGSQWQVNISYSKEQHALETAGGIINALPLLGDKPFLVVNGDVFTDYNFKSIPALSPDIFAHLWLVNNPSHNTKGDFAIKDGLLQNLVKNGNQLTVQQSYTYSGIAIFKPEFFQPQHFEQQKIPSQGSETALPLAPLLREAANKHLISASVLSGSWTDVGTPERLAQLNAIDKQ